MTPKTTTFLLFPLILSLVLCACAAGGPRKAGQPQVVTVVKEGERSEAKQREESEERLETFAKLSARMDEYQDLMATCEALSPVEENRRFRESCGERLKALRQELLDLSGRLEDPAE